MGESLSDIFLSEIDSSKLSQVPSSHRDTTQKQVSDSSDSFETVGQRLDFRPKSSDSGIKDWEFPVGAKPR